MKPGSSPHRAGNEKMFGSISYALVFLMMTCVIMTLSVLIRNVLPDWHSGILAGILLFIVTDRLLMYRQLKSVTPYSSEWLVAVGGHWIVIALFSRILLSYANGFAALLKDLSLFARGYLGQIFTAEFVIALMLALVIWTLTAQFLALLDELGLDMDLALQEDARMIQGDAVPAHQRMVILIFSTGVALVILTALTRLNLRNILENSSGLPQMDFTRFSGGEAGALLYFVFGLALLSLSRLMSLHTHWNREHIPVSSKNLPGQWAVYSLCFLLILAIVVSLLPAGDSLGFFSVLGTLLAFLASVFFFIGQLVLLLVSLLFSLPLLLLRGGTPLSETVRAVPLLPTPTEMASPLAGNAALALIRSMVLWGLLLVIIIFSLSRFTKQYGGLVPALRKTRVADWLTRAWQWLYKNTVNTGGGLTRSIANGWQNILSRLEKSNILPRPGFISVRLLNPRQKIYFFYLAMLRRGAERGIKRDTSQTPSEYAVKLEKAMPAATEDIESITEAFIEARYSVHEVTSRKANVVKATWARIRRALRGKARNGRTRNM